AASNTPMTPQRIQAGKNDPSMLMEGAREHPVANRADAIHVCNFGFMAVLQTGDRRFGMRDRLTQLIAEFARTHPQCAHPPTSAEQTRHRSGFAGRSYTTPTQRCRTPLLP